MIPAEQHSRLAAECGHAMVAAMPTSAWPALREEAVEMLHDAGPTLEGTLVPELDVSARMLAGAAPEHVAVLSEMLASRWSDHLARILAASSASSANSAIPSIAEAMRRLVERIEASALDAERAGKPMMNVARSNSTLFAVMDGNIIQHHHPRPQHQPQPQPRPRTAEPPDATDTPPSPGPC